MPHGSHGLIQNTLEKIVSKPIQATITVGSSIIVMMQLINYLSSLWPEVAYLKFIVPFIPPFFITRTAKRINQRKAEYHFIKDAKPYVFVAFPKELAPQCLLETQPDMFSDSAAKHFNCSLEDFSQVEALPRSFFTDPQERESLVTRLIEDFKSHNQHGTLENIPISITPKDTKTSNIFILNSVLIEKEGKLKWQATLTKHLSLEELQGL
ncbi:MAG: hypothetical protein QNL04_00625 [SAR324 cluster bacterium]|nr:hypothetical protein [SAR324 cluster bacterium]